MSTFTKSLRTFLLAGAAISEALGAKRIYPKVLPNSVVLPAVVISRISETKSQVLAGKGCLANAVIQIDAYSDTYEEASELSEKIYERLGAYMGPAGDHEITSAVHKTSRDSFEDDTRRHRVSSDYSIWSKEV